MEIRSRNSFRKKGWNPKKTTVKGTDFKDYSYKDWIIIA